LRSAAAPKYSRAPSASKLDPFKGEIHRLLGDDPKLPGQRVRELIEPLELMRQPQALATARVRSRVQACCLESS
jgi:hypothetical protein